MPQTDYYKTLQVKDNALDGEIQSAYRRLLKKYDPHGSSPDSAKLKEITQAYKVLGNPGARAEYDAARAAGALEAAPVEEPPTSPGRRRRGEAASPAAETAVANVVAEEAVEAQETASFEEETVPARPRRRRRAQPASRAEAARAPRRGERLRSARTRFDRTTRNRLWMLAAGVGVVLIVGIVLLALNVPLPGQRAYSGPPRSIDIWSIYPNDRVRFTSLFYPNPTDPLSGGESSVLMAGPLVAAADHIRSTVVIGGSQVSMALTPGPGDDSDLFFPMFTIARAPGGDPYGIDVMTINSPYVTPMQDGASVVALGVELQNVYEQVIVAVALPRDATITPVEASSGGSFLSYRNVAIGEWQIYYYDTTQATEQDPNAIRVTFQPGIVVPQTDLDPYEVDRRR